MTSARHRSAAARHLRLAAGRTNRIGVTRAVGDTRVLRHADHARRHLVAAASRKPDHRRRNRVIALVGAGLVVGGAAGGIAKLGRGRGSDDEASIPTGPDAESAPVTT
jgi:hypothetical protein